MYKKYNLDRYSVQCAVYSVNIHYFDRKKAHFNRSVDTAELLHGKSNERVFDLYRETSIEHNWKNVPL